MNAPSLAATKRSIPYRVRAGLCQRTQGEGSVFSDPTTGGQHELSSEETALVAWLADRPSLETLCRRYAQRFAPRRIEPTAMQQLLAKLHHAGLIESTERNTADALWRRRREESSERIRNAWKQLLAIRLPGGSPAPLVKPLGGIARAIFSPLGAVVAAGVVIAGFVAVASDFNRFCAELPRLQGLAEPRLLVGVLLVMACLKTLHEAAHALAARRFDVYVREAGVLLLFFVPCLYCDVSDAWRLASRWRRALITAAGVLCELTLAGIAALVWRFADPGPVSVIAMNTVLIATAGTLLVNLNPLVRFDGYYLLSDWLQAPNLAQRGRAALVERLTSPFTQNRSAADREPLGFAIYGLLSLSYVTLILIGFVWLVLTIGRAWRIDTLAIALVGVILATVAAGPLGRLTTFAKNPIASSRLRRGRVVLALLLVAVTLTAGLLAPWPHRPLVTVRTTAVEQGLVSVVRPGRLVSIAEAGEWVQAGQIVARLEDPAAERAVLRAEHEVRLRELDLRNLEARRAFDAEAASQLPTARAATIAAQTLLNEAQAETQRLLLRSPCAGQILPPAQERLSPGNEPPATRVDQQRVGQWLDVGQPICRIADPSQIEIEIVADEAIADRLEPGQSLRVSLATDAQIRGASLTRVSPRYEASARRGLSLAESSQRVASASFTMPLASGESALLDSSGVARIDLGHERIGTLIYNAACRLFVLPN